MDIIRRVADADISRIAEILVFSKRINYRPIFQNDDYSFGELQVGSVMSEYRQNGEKLTNTWVYDDGIIKGLIEIDGKEIKTLYVDPFFTSGGVGTELADFAVNKFGVDTLWVLEKNIRAQAFYRRHGFAPTREKIFEQGTTEYLVKMKRR